MRYLAVVAIVLLAVVVFSGEADGQDYCRADFNGDTRIDFADFLFFVQAFNQVSCEGYSFRDTTVVTRIDTFRMTVRDTLIVEVEDTTRINTLTGQRDSARADALKWRGKYDGLKDAYDYNRAVLLSDTAAVKRSVIEVINSLPDTTQAFVQERLSITCVGGSTPSTPTSSGGGSGSSSPDLIVESPSVDNTTLTPGQSLTLSATVRNRGTGQSAETTLRYYQSSDATITTDDTAVGTDLVNGLSASRTASESISLTAPSTTGTYYYGACVASVSGESNTNNNCSDGVRVTVSSGDGGGGGGSSGGGGGSSSPDLIVESPSVDNTTLTPGQSLTLSATVRNRGTAEVAATTLRYYQSSDATITTDDTAVGTADAISTLAASATSEQSSSVTAPLTAGTYYYGACVDVVSGESNTDNNCSTGVLVTVSSGGGTPKMYWGESYWTDNTRTTWTAKIRRANLDGSQVEDHITTGVRTPGFLVLDVEGRKMYWADDSDDFSGGKIKRANLDGSNVEDLITGFTGLQGPSGIALDVEYGKIYWIDYDTAKIRRANLDGSNVEELTQVGGRFGDLALDLGSGKMYWRTNNEIGRANLDGSNVEDLITVEGYGGGGGFALDVGSGKIYWTENHHDSQTLLFNGKIKRANLDGSNVEGLITGLRRSTGLENLRSLALDVGSGKMYWTDWHYDSDTESYNNSKIQRANLDGSNVEDLITGLRNPVGLTLDLRGQ